MKLARFKKVGYTLHPARIFPPVPVPVAVSSPSEDMLAVPVQDPETNSAPKHPMNMRSHRYMTVKKKKKRGKRGAKRKIQMMRNLTETEPMTKTQSKRKTVSHEIPEGEQDKHEDEAPIHLNEYDFVRWM